MRTLSAQLKANKESKGAARDQALRRIWVLKGVLEFDLDKTLMEQVSKKYEKLGLVPESYYMPEFFQGAQEEGKYDQH